jgi:outer membrane protein TolC
MRRIIVLSCLLAGSAAARELTLDQAVGQALAANPDLAASILDVDKARGRALQAGLPRNPELEIGGRSDWTFKNESERNFSLGVSQAIARKDRLRLAREAANLTVEQQALLVHDAQRQLIGEVQSLYLRVLTLDRQFAARQQLIETGGKLAAVIQQRYKTGEVPETDIAPIQIENAKLEQDQQLLLAQKNAAELKLKQALGLAPDEPLTLTSDLDALTARLEGIARAGATPETRPDYRAAKVAVAQAEAEVRVAKAEAYGDLTAGLNYENERSAFIAPIGVKQDQFLGFKVSVPLPVRNKNQGRILEQQAARRQAGAELEAVRQRVAAEVAQAKAAAAQLEPVLARYRDELIPLAEKQFQAVQRAYGQGQASIASVFQARQQRLSLELDYVGYLANRVDALASLDAALGQNPHLADE